MTVPLSDRPFVFLFVALSIQSFLVGCTVGPEYVAPQSRLPDAWRNVSLMEAPCLEGCRLEDWWLNFRDPLLSSLVQRALKGNRDLMAAHARLREARAGRDAAAGGLFPTVSASASASRRRGSSETGGGGSVELYAAGFDARWEIDIFGAKRRTLEAAEANLQAAQEDLRDVMVSLTAEAAITYLEVRLAQMRLIIARENMTTQLKTYEIASWRRQAGLVTQRDEDQALATLEQTKAIIPSLEASLEKGLNRLAVLLGENPGVLHGEFEGEFSFPMFPAGLALGIPADLLRRRPDIRRAERRLAAATANIGVAAAALYPSLPLTGSLGLEALSTGNLLGAGARTWALAVAPVLTLFDGGKNMSNVEAARTRQEQALAAYESALLGALADVEDSIVSYARELRRLEALSRAEEAGRSALKAAEDQYRAGLVDFLAVLDSQRTLLSIQEQRALSEAAVLTDIVKLYKAMGGGWRSAEGEGS